MFSPKKSHGDFRIFRHKTVFKCWQTGMQRVFNLFFFINTITYLFISLTDIHQYSCTLCSRCDGHTVKKSSCFPVLLPWLLLTLSCVLSLTWMLDSPQPSLWASSLHFQVKSWLQKKKKCPDSIILGFCRPYSICYNFSALPVWHQSVSMDSA